MKIPKGDQSYWNKSAKYLYGFYSGWFNKIIIGLIVIAPPALIGTLYSNNDLKRLIPILTSESTYNFIASTGRDHVLLFNAISFLWPIVLLAIGSEIAKKAQSNGLSVDGLLALIGSLDSIVGIKNKRFNSHVNNIERLSKETAFEEITNPYDQIAEIVREICSFFNATRSEKTRVLIRVTLAVIKNDKIESLPIFYPNDEPIKSSLASLNDERSAFLVAYRTKKMVLITDIKKELEKTAKERKFAETENEEDNSGSMICYPIRVYNSSIPFVISIHSDEAGYFKDEFKSLYEHSLMRFALRLSVENSLLIMKENLCAKQI